MPRAVVLPALVLAAACAASRPPAAAPRASLPPLPRSSIAAVLLHREELGLSDDQVSRMQAIDEQLAEANAALDRRARKPGRPDARTGASPRARGMGRHHFHGGRARAAPAPRATRAETLQERKDDNDTRAYLEAEQVLSGEQRERARDIAERYREELYDRRVRR